MENEEIDLIEVITKLWRQRRIILWYVLGFLIVGAAIAFLLPRKYTAECILGLEGEDKTTRISVEGASIFENMNMGGVRDVKIVSPAMYPDIVFSVPFQKELIYTPLFVNEKGDSITFYDYLIKPGSQDRDRYSNAGSGVEQLTPQENRCLEYLKDAITVKYNEKKNNLKISVDMPEGHMTAQLAQKVQLMLQQYLTRFRVARAQAALDFIDGRYHEIKHVLEQKQAALVKFYENYKGGNSVQSTPEEKILNNDYELFFGLYSDFVKQREKARIQVKEDMPVLTVIEPVVEPTDPSKPRRVLILLVSLVLGGMVGCCSVLFSSFLEQRRKDRKV